MHEQEIRQIAEFRGVPFHVAAQAACDGFTKAVGRDDCVCRYKNGEFKMWRVIDEEGLTDIFYDVINQTLANY